MKEVDRSNYKSGLRYKDQLREFIYEDMLFRRIGFTELATIIDNLVILNLLTLTAILYVLNSSINFRFIYAA